MCRSISFDISYFFKSYARNEFLNQESSHSASFVVANEGMDSYR